MFRADSAAAASPGCGLALDSENSRKSSKTKLLKTGKADLGVLSEGSEEGEARGERAEG